MSLISKIYGSNQILHPVGSRKGKTKRQIRAMDNAKKDWKYKKKYYGTKLQTFKDYLEEPAKTKGGSTRKIYGNQ